MRRYGLLLVAVAGLGVVLVQLGRLTGRAAAPADVAPDAPRVERAFEIEEESVSPAVSAVPKGSRVLLRLENRGSRHVSVRLAGYEDRLHVRSLEPGGSWSGEFLADRPGDEFAWLVNGRPAGRLSVTGSHLTEGHR